MKDITVANVVGALITLGSIYIIGELGLTWIGAFLLTIGVLLTIGSDPR
jgi:hypothetical protein